MSRGSAPRFHPRRTHQSGDALVETGFRGGVLQIRVKLTDTQSMTLSLEDAEDLADMLDEAITEQEAEPLL